MTELERKIYDRAFDTIARMKSKLEDKQVSICSSMIEVPFMGYHGCVCSLIYDVNQHLFTHIQYHKAVRTGMQYVKFEIPNITMTTFTLQSATVNAAADLLEANLIRHTIDGNDIIVAEHYTDGVKMLFKKHLILFTCE
jgi:hypothetical protein